MKQLLGILISTILLLASCSQGMVKNNVQNVKSEYNLDSFSNVKYQDFFDETGTLNYNQLLAYRQIEKQIPEGIERRNYYDVLALLECYVGNYNESIEITDRARLEPTDMMTFEDDGTMTKSIFYPKSAFSEYPDSLFNSDYFKIDFKELLLTLNDTIQVFGLNESHTVSIFRSSLYNALPILKSKGYKYLLLETLYQEKQNEHNSSKYPLRSSGFFSSETTMGDVIRKAKDLGFILISYDAQGESSKIQRETMSFQNIKQRILVDDPNAKMILFAGHSHIYESNIGKIKPLGVQFKETGIDPFTVDQIKYYERNVPNSISAPTVLMNRNVNSVAQMRYDATLVLPKSTIKYGRPSWLWEMNRKPIEITKDIIKDISTPFILEAFIKGESNDGVPLDRIEITDKHKLPSLSLRRGEFLIKLTSKENEIREYSINVK